MTPQMKNHGPLQLNTDPMSAAESQKATNQKQDHRFQIQMMQIQLLQQRQQQQQHYAGLVENIFNAQQATRWFALTKVATLWDHMVE